MHNKTHKFFNFNRNVTSVLATTSISNHNELLGNVEKHALWLVEDDIIYNIKLSDTLQNVQRAIFFLFM